jgi:hypothetical protein
MGASGSTPTRQLEISPVQIVNTSGVDITAKSGIYSVYIDNQKTGTLNVCKNCEEADSSVKIYSGDKELENISLKDLLSQGLNPVIYIKPSVQILSSDSLLPGKKSNSPQAMSSLMAMNSSPIPTVNMGYSSPEPTGYMGNSSPEPTGYMNRPTINATPIPPSF